MRDPIDSLAHLTPGDPVDQPPASEIRRRGAALRRRRAATIAIGAAVAVAAVVVPAALLNRPDLPIDPATDDPSSTQTEDPTNAVVTEVPDDFPIEIGLSTRDQIEQFGPGERGEIGTELEPFAPCGEQIWPADGIDTLDVSSSAPEFWETRQLATYASADDAVAVIEAARAALDGCTEYPGGDAQVLEVLDGDTGYDDVTFGFYEASGMPGGTVVQLVRVGSAVVLLSASGEYTADSIQSGADDLTWASQEIATHMCVFTEAGCGEGSDAWQTSIPGGFTLTPADEAELEGWTWMSDGAFGIGEIELCGDVVFAEDPVVDRVAVDSEPSSVSADVAARELRLYADDEAAETALQEIGDAVAACQHEDRGDGASWVHMPATQSEPLSESQVAFSRTFEVDGNAALGVELWTLARVGNAVVGNYVYLEHADLEAGIPLDGIPVLSPELVAQLCPFNPAGC